MYKVSMLLSSCRLESAQPLFWPVWAACFGGRRVGQAPSSCDSRICCRARERPCGRGIAEGCCDAWPKGGEQPDPFSIFFSPLFNVTQQSELSAKMQQVLVWQLQWIGAQKNSPSGLFWLVYHCQIPVPRIVTPIVENTAGVSEASWASRVEKTGCS